MLLEDDGLLEPWEEVMNRLREEIPRIYPEWTDYNIHDPGITILELFAWMRQVQMYHASRIGMGHLRKYVGILGIQPVRRTPGHTLVTVNAPEGRYIEKGSRFYAGNICFEAREAQMVVESAFLGFETVTESGSYTLSGGWLAEGRGISLCPFGDRPKQGNIFVIDLAAPLKEGSTYRLYLESCHEYPVKRRPVAEAEFDGHGYYPLAQISMEYQAEDGWQKAEIIRDETYGLLQDGSICFRLSQPMGGGGWRLRFVLERSDYLVAPRISRISLAMAEVWQQETQEQIARWRGSGLPDQQYELADGRIAWGSISLLVEDEWGTGHMEEWSQVDDFDRSIPEDRHFCLENGHLIFGDGFKGRIPEGEIRIERAVYTLGKEGNIKAGTITRMEGEYPLPVVNEWDVTGGTNEESPKETLARYREEGTRLQRAVTWEDYEQLVLQIPGLLIADCKVYADNPERREITIAVRPFTLDGHGYLNEAYKKNLYRYLEEKRLIGTRLVLVSPEYFQLEVTCIVAAKIQYRDAGSLIEREITAWIGQKKFGEGIRYGELRGFVDTLPCVRRVESLWLNTGSKGKRNRLGDVLLPPNGLFLLNRVVCSLTD